MSPKSPFSAKQTDIFPPRLLCKTVRINRRREQNERGCCKEQQHILCCQHLHPLRPTRLPIPGGALPSHGRTAAPAAAVVAGGGGNCHLHHLFSDLSGTATPAKIFHRRFERQFVVAAGSVASDGSSSSGRSGRAGAAGLACCRCCCCSGDGFPLRRIPFPWRIGCFS